VAGGALVGGEAGGTTTFAAGTGDGAALDCGGVVGFGAAGSVAVGVPNRLAAGAECSADAPWDGGGAGLGVAV